MSDNPFDAPFELGVDVQVRILDLVLANDKGPSFRNRAASGLKVNKQAAMRYMQLSQMT